MTYDEVLAETRQSMEKALTHLGDVLRGIRTSRASTALVDHIRVEYYGTPTPISQLAAVSIPEPRQLMIKPFDANSVKDVEKALLKSDLGITPQSDGKVIRLTMPPLSGEQRKKYAAKVKDMVEDARIAMRNGRREHNKQADALLKEGGLTEDQNHKLHDEIQTVLKDYEKRLDGILEKKTAEVMEV
jgi:ribosome recycling factor